MCFRFKPEDLDAMVTLGSAQTRVRPKQWRPIASSHPKRRLRQARIAPTGNDLVFGMFGGQTVCVLRNRKFPRL
jgi:hypothetical protein